MVAVHRHVKIGVHHLSKNCQVASLEWPKNVLRGCHMEMLHSDVLLHGLQIDNRPHAANLSLRPRNTLLKKPESFGAGGGLG